LSHNETEYVGAFDQCQANAYLAAAPRHRIGEDAVDSDHGQNQGRRGEDSEQKHHEAGLSTRAIHEFFYGLNASDRLVSVKWL
jgi:hypothetical protein